MTFFFGNKAFGLHGNNFFFFFRRLRLSRRGHLHGAADQTRLVQRLHRRGRHHADLGHSGEGEGPHPIRRTQGVLAGSI